jgi:hypothetical protein
VTGEPGDHIVALKAFLVSHDIELSYANAELGAAHGASLKGRILLRDDLSPAVEFSVLVHEIAHELLHTGDRRADTSKTVRETEAEAVVRLPIARRRQYGWDAKDFSDLINPLKRFLRSCIGRPWNKVHSELSQKLDRRSISGCHIWDHVMLEIETDCYIGPDRLAYSNNRKYGHGEWPIDGFYVAPRTGLIREQRPKWRGPSRVSRPLSISTVIAAPPTDDGN